MYNFDLYLDRNMNNNFIRLSLFAFYMFLKSNKNNQIFKYNSLAKKKNDIAIIFGMWCKFKENTIFRKKVINNYSNILIIEKGYLKRDKYRSLSWNNTGGKSNIILKKYDSKRFNKLNLELINLNVNYEGYILVCGQLPWDRQVQFMNMSYNEWLNKLFLEIQKKTTRKIIFRYHPLYKSKNKNFIEYSITIPNFVEIDKNIDFTKSVKKAYVVIAYNSTVLIDSIIMGCPIICFDDMSLVYNLARHSINDINNLLIPTKEQILQTLYYISYCQWNLEEIKNGEALRFMLNLLEN